MPTVTSPDGTNIAFDRVGSGPAVILVNGATAYRAFDPSMTHLAELLGKHFTAYNYDRRGPSNVVQRDRRGTYSCLRRGVCRRCHAGQTAPT